MRWLYCLCSLDSDLRRFKSEKQKIVADWYSKLQWEYPVSTADDKDRREGTRRFGKWQEGARYVRSRSAAYLPEAGRTVTTRLKLLWTLEFVQDGLMTRGKVDGMAQEDLFVGARVR